MPNLTKISLTSSSTAFYATNKTITLENLLTTDMKNSAFMLLKGQIIT